MNVYLTKLHDAIVAGEKEHDYIDVTSRIKYNRLLGGKHINSGSYK